MKKILLFTFMACATIGMLKGQSLLTVDGQISNAGGLPVKVEITVDPNTTSAVSLYTISDTSGYYFDSTTVSSVSGTVMVMIKDCNGDSIVSYGAYGPGRYLVTVNFNFCAPSPATCMAFYGMTQAFDSLRNPIPYAVQISNLSTGTGLTYSWDFGDGTTATGLNATHTYSGTGPYLLCLTVSNSTCTDTFCDSVSVDSSGLLNKSAEGLTLIIGSGSTTVGLNDLQHATARFELFPNPTDNILNVRTGETTIKIHELRIHSVTGAVVWQRNYEAEAARSSAVKVDVSRLKGGMYYLQLVTNEGSETHRFVKK